jgi:acetyl esterase
MNTHSWQQLGEQNFPTRFVMQNVLSAYVPDGTSAYEPLIAPLWADLLVLPPALLLVRENDPLLDECLDYVTQLAAVGVTASATVYPGSGHGFIQFFKDTERQPQGAHGLLDGVAFLRHAFSPPQL